MPSPAGTPFERTDALAREAHLLRHEVGDLRHFLRTLQEMAELVDRSRCGHDLTTLVEAVLARVLDGVSAEDGALMLVDEAAGELVYVAGSEGLPGDRLRGQRMPLDHGLAGWVVEHRSPMVMESPHGEQTWGGAETGPWLSALTVIAAPLVAGGEVLGVVEVFHRRRTPFAPEQLDMLTLACRFAGELLHSLENRPRPAHEAY